MAFDSTRGVPTLATGRLRLRPLTEADSDAIFALYSDPRVTRYLARTPMATTADARAAIERAAEEFAAGTAIRVGLTPLDDDRVIGTGNLLHFDWGCRRAEVGYALVPAFWGQGLAAEVTAALVEYGFETLDLHRLEAELDPRNEASTRVLERQGFVKEGLLRERWIVGDEVSDSLLMGLLRSDYRNRAIRSTA